MYSFFFNNKKIDLLCCILVLFTYQSSIVGYMCIVVLRLLKISQMNEHVLLIYKEILISFSVFNCYFNFYFNCKFLISPNVYAKNHTSIVTSFEMFAENIRYSFNILNFSSSLFEYAISISFIMIGILFIYNIIFKNKK